MSKSYLKVDAIYNLNNQEKEGWMIWNDETNSLFPLLYNKIISDNTNIQSVIIHIYLNG